MTKKIKNPKEAICLCSYEKPLRSIEITEKLYGSQSRNNRVSTWITDLINETGHIKRVDIKGIKRSFDYYQTTSKFIVDSIKKDITLSPREEKKLLELFDLENSRNFLAAIITAIDLRDNDMTIIKEKLGYFSVYFYAMIKHSASMTNRSLSVSLKQIKKQKGVSKNNIKHISMNNFKKFIPERVSKNINDVNNMYIDFSMDYYNYMDIPLLEKLSLLSSNVDMIFLLITGMLTWDKTIKEVIQQQKERVRA